MSSTGQRRAAFIGDLPCGPNREAVKAVGTRRTAWAEREPGRDHAAGEWCGGIMGDETLDAESGGPPRTPWWTAVWWAGVGVLLAGIGVLGYALAVADRGYR